jgi:hypothetical protein
MGFRMGRRTVDNIFIIRTIFDKYLKNKISGVYLIFSNLQKAVDTVVKEAMVEARLDLTIGLTL